MTGKKFSLKQRAKSFTHAFNGFRLLLKEEHNARIHLAAAIVAIVLGVLFKISVNEWLAVLIVIAMVFALEIVNSAIERMCDHVTPEQNDSIKKIKDLAAVAVFVAAIFAGLVGLIIFLPKLWHFFLRLI